MAGRRAGRGGAPEVPARIAWAVQVVDPRPHEHVLEIGCGPGVAAALVCDRLTTGHLLAIDRSALAVTRTARRCAAHLAAGRLHVIQAAVEALDLPPAGLDTVFAVDVNLFWTSDVGQVIDVLTRSLRPGGALHVLYGAAGPTSSTRITQPVARSLGAHGLETTASTGDAGFGVTGRLPQA